VIGIRRDPRAGAAGHADAVHAMSELKALLPQADFVALTCPLTRKRGQDPPRRTNDFKQLLKSDVSLPKINQRSRVLALPFAAVLCRLRCSL
jgi:hypothetical protein